MADSESIEREAGDQADHTTLMGIAALSKPHDSVTDVIDDVLDLVPQVIPCECALLYLFDNTTDRFHLFASNGKDTVIPLSESSVARRIWSTGRGEVLNGVEGDPEFNPLIERIVEPRQLVGAPVTVEGENLGMLAVANSPDNGFGDADLRKLTILADRVAVAIQLVQVRQAVARQSQELEALHRLSRLLVATETLEHVVAESSRMVCDLLDCDKMVVLLLDEDEEALIVVPPMIGVEEGNEETLRVDLTSPSLIGTVFRTNTPLRSNEAEADAWVDPGMRSSLDIHSMLVAPITSGTEPIGVLLAINSKRGIFSEADERFLSLLGGRVGGVIEASRARSRERALVQQLREADRTKSEFVSMLAHELKNPMVTISGFSEVLRDQSDRIGPEKVVEIAGILNSEVDRLARLVHDLLDLSRMEAGTIRYELQPTSLQEAVDGLLVLHTSLDANHIVSADIPEDLPKVLADRDRLSQVLLNMLMNAARYSREGTVIGLGAVVVDEDGRSKVQVSVSDEGIGIAPEDQERVFSKFVMLPKPAWVKKGTGLGLFITKGIVEAHGGRIWIESTPGKGSTFIFTLDVANGPS